MALPSLRIGKVKVAKAIVQQGMAIMISLWDIAAAVANKGGVGTIGGSALTPSQLREQIRKARQNTNTEARGALAVNLMRAVKNFRKLLDVCIEEGVDILFVGAGVVEDELFEYCEGKIELVPIVSHPVLIKKLHRSGKKPPAIVVEAGLAGGHLGPKEPESEEAGWRALLKRFRDTLQQLGWEDIPLIIAGGLLTKQDVCEALEMGASAVGIGYRFAMSYDAQPRLNAWQNVMLNLTDAIVTGGKSSPGSPTGFHSRMGVTQFTELLLKQGYVHIGKPECKYDCLEHCIYRSGDPADQSDPFTKSFCINMHLRLALEGDPMGLYFPSGRFREVKELIHIHEYIEELDGGCLEAV